MLFNFEFILFIRSRLDIYFIAEGLVLRTDLGLRNRMGERLIVKIKYEDFQKYRNVYGTDDPVEQIPNEHY